MPVNNADAIYNPDVQKIFEKSPKKLILICISLLTVIILLIYTLMIAIRSDRIIHFEAYLTSNPVVESSLLTHAGYIINQRKVTDSAIVNLLLRGTVKDSNQKEQQGHTEPLKRNLLIHGEIDKILFEKIKNLHQVLSISFSTAPGNNLGKLKADLFFSSSSHDPKKMVIVLKVPFATMGDENYYYYNYPTVVDINLGKESFFNYMFQPLR